MPIMDGLEAAIEIRKIEKSSRIASKIPIIAVTAFNSNEDIKKCYEAGFNLVIPKPATKSALKEAIFELQQNRQVNISNKTYNL